MNMKKIILLMMFAVLAIICTACGSEVAQQTESEQVIKEKISNSYFEIEEGSDCFSEAEKQKEEAEISDEAILSTETENKFVEEQEVTESAQNGFLIVIDAGHQAKGNSEKEPVGPGRAK